jgi:hypothetical protein
LGESNQQRLNNFITASSWQFQQIKDTVTLQFWELLQRSELDRDACLMSFMLKIKPGFYKTKPGIIFEPHPAETTARQAVDERINSPTFF